MKGIVGFKIIIDEVQAAFKLSQNRHDRNYARIIKAGSRGRSGNGLGDKIEFKGCMRKALLCSRVLLLF